MDEGRRAGGDEYGCCNSPQYDLVCVACVTDRDLLSGLFVMFPEVKLYFDNAKRNPQ